MTIQVWEHENENTMRTCSNEQCDIQWIEQHEQQFKKIQKLASHALKKSLPFQTVV